MNAYDLPMAKAKNKTVETTDSVAAFIDTLPQEQVREDCRVLVKMMQKATGEPPKMWGAAIVGFGNYVVTSMAGREVDWLYCGFSPRKASLSLYLMPGSFEEHAAALKKLGPHSVGKGCLYIKRLSDVDLKVLEQLVGTTASASMRRAGGGGGH